MTVVFGRRPTDIPAVRDVSLVVHAGEIVGLTGPSGCGKSTLALALLGLVRTPGHITAGRIAVGDVPDLLALPERLRREIRGRDVALIMQNPRAALHPLYRIGRQIGAVIAAHESISPSQRATGCSSCCVASALPIRAGASTRSRRSSREAWRNEP